MSEKNSTERDLELKEQALQKAQLRVKELEFAQESYQEYQQQAKVGAVVLFIRCFCSNFILYSFKLSLNVHASLKYKNTGKLLYVETPKSTKKIRCTENSKCRIYNKKKNVPTQI